MTNQLIQNGCALLDQDVATTLELPWAVRTYTADLWTSRTYKSPDPGDLEGFDRADLLLVVDKNIKVLDGDSVVEILLCAADEVATEIMDRLNRPWPDLPAVGGMLEIRLVDDAIVWCHAGETVCKLGNLGAIAMLNCNEG